MAGIVSTFQQVRVARVNVDLLMVSMVDSRFSEGQRAKRHKEFGLGSICHCNNVVIHMSWRSGLAGGLGEGS